MKRRRQSLNRFVRIVYGHSGQTTAEYALVLLVAGLIVGVFGAFVKSGALTDMFQNILSGLIDRAGG
jgi:Flp pilus assembly pilin Flp